MARKSFGPFGKISREDAYDIVINGIECGNSVRIVSGSWGDALDAAEAGGGDAFASIVVSDAYGDGEEPSALSDAAISRGLDLLAEQVPHLWKSCYASGEYDGDALSDDAVLQLASFGSVIYG